MEHDEESFVNQQRLDMVNDIINKLSRSVQKITRVNERDQLIKDIAYYNLYRRSIMDGMAINNFAATYGKGGTSVNG